MLCFPLLFQRLPFPSVTAVVFWTKRLVVPESMVGSPRSRGRRYSVRQQHLEKGGRKKVAQQLDTLYVRDTAMDSITTCAVAAAETASSRLNLF